MANTTALHPLAVLGKGTPTGMLRGYCTTNFGVLVSTMGMPHIQGEPGEVEWAFRCQNGTVFTVYLCKERELPLGKHRWHIGGTSNALAAFNRLTGLDTDEWEIHL